MPCKSIEELTCEQETQVVQKNGYALGGVGSLILWFIIIAVIVWFILWALKPKAVQVLTPSGEPTGQLDAGKVLIASIIIALIIVLIIWLIRSCARY